MSVKLDVTGERYGRLVGLKCVGSSKGHTVWLWKCDCGNTKEIPLVNVRMGYTKSCGCYAQECRTKHGMSKTKLYSVYSGILGRCNDKKHGSYARYGGRGIKCTFKDFEDFYNHVSLLPHFDKVEIERLTVNRIDNDGNYEKGNIEWSTYRKQEINKRLSKNNTSGYEGVSFSKIKNRWCARMEVKGKKNPGLGYFKTKEEAIAARKKAEQEYRSTILY